MAEKLPDKLTELSRVCRKHGVALVCLFGSRSGAGAAMLAGEKVEAGDPLADLDVGIVTEAPLPQPPQRARFYAALYNDLEDIFKPLPLDLVLLEENHSVFQLEAIKGICVLPGQSGEARCLRNDDPPPRRRFSAFPGEVLGDKLVEMADYRNRLVHLYNEVTDEDLYGILAADLGDIRSFVKQIRSFLKQSKPMPGS